MATKTGFASVSQGRSDVHKIDPRIIVVESGWNVRDETPDYLEYIKELKASIKEIGVQEPLVCIWKDNKPVLRSGHTRMLAVMELIKEGTNIQAVPVRSEDRYSDEADQLFGQILRNSGRALSPFEKARIYKKLIDYGWNQTKIAAKEGVSPGRISQILDLLAMPVEVKNMVAAGQVSATTAAQVVKSEGVNATTVLTNAVAAAQADGKDKATAQHIEQVTTPAAPVAWANVQVPQTVAPAPVRAQSVEQVVKDVLEASTIDNSADDVVTITMSHDTFEILRELFKL